MTQSHPSNITAACWTELDKEKQATLLVEYGYYLDSLPPTCSLQAKNKRFAQWLAAKNIEYNKAH